VSPIEQYESALRRVDALLREFGIRFHLTGGAASIVHGEPRLTLDVDLVIDREQLTNCLSGFLAAVERDGFVHSAPTITEAVRTGRQFQLLDVSDGVKLDFYPRELVPGELQRSIDFEIVPGFSIPLVSRTDLAIAKLIWISRGSHKSRRDLRKILTAATQSETATVHRAADERGLQLLLDEVLAEPDDVPE